MPREEECQRPAVATLFLTSLLAHSRRNSGSGGNFSPVSYCHGLHGWERHGSFEMFLLDQ